MKPQDETRLAAIKRLDSTRQDFPGEHLIVLAAGVTLMLASLRSSSPLPSREPSYAPDSDDRQVLFTAT